MFFILFLFEPIMGHKSQTKTFLVVFLSCSLPKNTYTYSFFFFFLNLIYIFLILFFNLLYLVSLFIHCSFFFFFFLSQYWRTKQTSLKTTIHLPKKEHHATRAVFGHSGHDWSNIGLRNPKTIRRLCSKLAQRSPTNRGEITLKTKWTKAP